MMVRCIDNFLQSDVLIEGHRYEVLGERDDCYVLSGLDKPLSKVRFEPVTPPIDDCSAEICRNMSGPAQRRLR